MAGVPPPAVPLPPVAANVLAAPISDDVPVVLDAAEPCVLSTPCLEWAPAAVAGAVAQVSVPHWRMLRAFIARCSIGSDPASFAMARATSLFVFILNAAAWTRILTELRDSGLFARVSTRRLVTSRQHSQSSCHIRATEPRHLQPVSHFRLRTTPVTPVMPLRLRNQFRLRIRKPSLIRSISPIRIIAHSCALL